MKKQDLCIILASFHNTSNLPLLLLIREVHAEAKKMTFIYILLVLCACILSCFSRVWFFTTLWITVSQATLSMGFSRQVYSSEFSCPPPGDLPDPEIKLHLKLHLLHWQVGCLTLAQTEKPFVSFTYLLFYVFVPEEVIVISIMFLKHDFKINIIYRTGDKICMLT